MTFQAETALNLPPTTSFDHWLTLGRELAGRKHSIDWLIGDWLSHGRTHFAEAVEPALPGLIDDTRARKRIERTAKAFPPDLREPGLTFDHHAHVADMPTEEALPLLKQAKVENLPARRLRVLAMDRKVEIGQILPREDDVEDDEIMKLVRAWNRASRGVRGEFSEMVGDARLGLVDPTGRVK